MPCDPTEILGEVLGRHPEKGFDPEDLDYECPFLGSRCTKRGGSAPNEPYPVCAIRHPIAGVPRHVCVCPKRFHSVDFLADAVEHCWPGDPPGDYRIAREVKLTGFGNVDFVIAEMGQDDEIEQFLSVELQAMDFSGSVKPAYEALLAGLDLERRPDSGPNWSNVYKRFVSQLVRKGFVHHHWGTKIVAVVQDVFYDYIKGWAEFLRTDDVEQSAANIIFMSYKYKSDTGRGDRELVLDAVEGTSHADLQQAVIYKEAPSRDVFCKGIATALSRRKQRSPT